MTDIVERLECNGRNCCLDAKAEIERLRADNARLRAALLEIRENIVVASVCRAYLDPIDEIARAALEARDE